MPKRARLLIAIDGPAGAGKSTVARMLADRVGYVLVDTGALYRSVALCASRAGHKTHGDLTRADEEVIAELAERLAADKRVGFGPDGVVLLDGEDVSKLIRTPDISLGASRVSAIPRVRAALLQMQRQAGEAGGAVMEGRDIGTVVFPDADLKFFLTASSSERASRRHAELAAKGTSTTLEATLADVERRDKADTERPVAPLKQAEDAILVDSSERTIEDVVELMVREVRSREAGA